MNSYLLLTYLLHRYHTHIYSFFCFCVRQTSGKFNQRIPDMSIPHQSSIFSMDIQSHIGLLSRHRLTIFSLNLKREKCHDSILVYSLKCRTCLGVVGWEYQVKTSQTMNSVRFSIQKVSKSHFLRAASGIFPDPIFHNEEIQKSRPWGFFKQNT